MELDAWHLVAGLSTVVAVLSTGLASIAGYVWHAESRAREEHGTKLLAHGDRLTRLEANMLTRDALKADLREVKTEIMDAIRGMDAQHKIDLERVDIHAREAHRKADELRRDISGA